MNTNFNTLKTIEHIYTNLSNSKLSEDILFALDDNLNVLANYLSVNGEEAMLFAIVFSFQITDSNCDYKSIASYLGVSEFRTLELSGLMKNLSAKKLCFTDKRNRRRHYRSSERTEYRVNKALFSAIINNEAFPEKAVRYVPDAIEWLESIRCFIDDELEYLERHEKDIEIDQRLESEVDGDFPVFLDNLNINRYQKLFLIYAIWEALVNDTFFTPDNFFSNLPKSNFFAHQEKKKLLNGDHYLIEKEMISIQPAQFGNDIEVGLTDEFKEELKEYGIEFANTVKKKKGKITLKHDDITPKELYYNEEEERQLTTLTNLLQRDNFTSLQKRMTERGLPIGVSVLFFGSPGTGKTESVLQLARLTGRDIIQVDISESKSMWFGQSEKIVKRIFTDYKAACEESEVTPILFINEADAILAKRNSGESNVKQTENAIQNILLEEMEKLEGILIATTNLEINLDAAFDRRFLFKVKYNKPGITQRQKIWKDKLPGYTDELMSKLANQFHLSGGQIDNIVRKTEIDFVLNGSSTSEALLLSYCKDELALAKGGVGNRIGF